MSNAGHVDVLIAEGTGSSTVQLSFKDLYHRIGDRPSPGLLPRRIVALDPGETTGISVWAAQELKLLTGFQADTSTIDKGVDQLEAIFRTFHPKVDPGSSLASVIPSLHHFPRRTSPLYRKDLLIVIEDYRIYAWRIKQHAWASLHTPRLIGVVETLCRLNNVRLVKQNAQTGKGFCTDDRLKSWDFYLEGQQHARDAIRHGAQFLLFGDT